MANDLAGTREVRALIAQRMRARIDDVVDAMVSGYQTEIDAYALMDPNALSEVHMMTHVNVDLISRSVEHGTDLDEDQLQRLADLGSIRASQGFPLHALLRAYQVGTTVAWRYILEEITAQEVSNELAVATIVSLSETILRLSGQVSGVVC